MTVETLQRAEHILKALAKDNLRIWITETVEHHVVVLVTEHYHFVASLLMGRSDNIAHAEADIFLTSGDAVLLLVACQCIVDVIVKPLYRGEIGGAEVEPYHGILLPFPVRCGNKQLRLLDALLSSKSLEQVATTFEDGCQRRDEQ